MIPASPFACRFDTSFQATPEEHKQIRQIISTAVDEYTRIDALIHDLTIQRDALQQHIEKHRELIPPIHGAPVEIVQKIFNHCLPSDHNAIMSVHEVPLLLGHVCSAWRQISHSMPQLWSSIHINNPSICPVPFQEVYCEAIESWLHRSSDLPLSISLAENKGDWNLMRKMIDILARFSPRWEHLALNLRSCDSLSSMKGVTTPLLTNIVINGPSIPNQKLLDALSFLHTPSLRAASLGGGYTSILSLIHWKNMIHLNLGFARRGSHPLYVNEALKILRASPSLVTCKLGFIIDYPSEFDVITLPCLNILHLGIYLCGPTSIPLIDNLLSLLDMPNLRHLYFETLSQATLVVPFKLSLNRLQHLTTLEYAISNVAAHEIGAAFALIPSVRCLRLSVDDTFLDTSTQPPGSSLSCALLMLLQGHAQIILLPALEHLDIQADETSDITEDTLLELILSRTDRAPAGIARLKRVGFSFDRPRLSSTDIMSALNGAIADGLRVQITYRDAKTSEKNGTGIIPYHEMELAAQSREWEWGFWNSRFIDN